MQPQDAEQLAVVRAQLETLAVDLLTECGTEEDFNLLESLAEECNGLIEKGDIGTTFEKDSLLHLEIARRTKNRYLYEIFEKIDAKIQLQRLVLRRPLDKLKMSVKHHNDIINAMRRRDKALAVTLMKHHIMHQIDEYQSAGPQQKNYEPSGLPSGSFKRAGLSSIQTE
jgi:DNA-binding GntR family transcriptional regulator